MNTPSRRTSIVSLFFGALVLAFLFPCLAPAYNTARIVDARTGEPVAGAYVYYQRVYITELPLAGTPYPEPLCPRIRKRTETDDSGVYRLFYTGPPSSPICDGSGYGVVIYKPGYYLGHTGKVSDFLKYRLRELAEKKRPASYPTFSPPEIELKPYDGEQDYCEEWEQAERVLDDFSSSDEDMASLRQSADKHYCSLGLELIKASQMRENKGYEKTVSILDRNPEIIDYQNYYTSPAVCFATGLQNYKVATYLVEHGADVNVTCKKMKIFPLSALRLQIIGEQRDKKDWNSFHFLSKTERMLMQEEGEPEHALSTVPPLLETLKQQSFFLRTGRILIVETILHISLLSMKQLLRTILNT